MQDQHLANHESNRLDSWKEIATYLGKDVRTAQRWEKQLALPVHRLAGSRSGSVFAYRQEIDAWRNFRAGLASGKGQMPEAEEAAVDLPDEALDLPLAASPAAFSPEPSAQTTPALPAIEDAATSLEASTAEPTAAQPVVAQTVVAQPATTNQAVAEPAAAVPALQSSSLPKPAALSRRWWLGAAALILLFLSGARVAANSQPQSPAALLGHPVALLGQPVAPLGHPAALSAPIPPTVAVLPFTRLGEAPELRAAALALPDYLTTRLAMPAAATQPAPPTLPEKPNLPEKPTLRILPRTSLTAPLAEADFVRHVRQKLGATLVVEGSVQSLAGCPDGQTGLRVAARLVDTASEAIAWSNQWDACGQTLQQAEETLAANVIPQVLARTDSPKP